MTFDQYIGQALSMTDEEIEQKLRSLALDPRWPAVVALAARQRQEAESIVVNPKTAANHGMLGHAAGALYQANLYLDWLERYHPPQSPNG
jgi:hypothetical protein